MLEQRWTGALRHVIRTALVTAAALAAFAVLHPGAAAAQEGSPTAPRVWVEYDYGNGPLDFGLGTDWFTANAAVDVQLFASPGGALLWSASLPTDEFGDVNRCCLSELLDFDPAFGMHLVVTDPATLISRDVTLVRVGVDEIDPVADTVTGTAPPGAEMVLSMWDDAFRAETVADENGAWLVDLGAIGVDVTWQSNYWASTWDEDGDTIGAHGAPATIAANVTTDTVSGSWFSLEAALAVEILDAGGAPLWTGTVPTGLGRSFAVGPEAHGLELLPGMLVRVTDPVGGFTKAVTIVPLSIDVLDPVRDFAAGTGVPGTNLWMGIWFPGVGGGEVADDIAVDATGAWSYDFANPPAGRPQIDVLADTVVDVAVFDAEWDSTGATITATPGAIAHLQDDVAGLLAEGGLTAVEAAQLQKKLDDALGKLDDGKTAAAIEKLESFVARVESLVTAGKLSPAAGSELIAQAAGVIAALRA
ncbi:MAG TPA: hypothetical protein VF044_04825 [Actinomycetota bacterium]